MKLKKVRFLPYSVYSPYENMAIDEYLLQDFMEKGVPSFRLYGWNPAGLSIGINQKIDTVNTELCQDLGIPVVRRMTGGGAILHKNELTYSLAVPRESVGMNTSIRESFEAISKFIIETYSGFGLEARYARDVYPEQKHGQHSPFCFSSSEEYDMIIAGRKIGGNAQARKKTAVFQHGSIPLKNVSGEELTYGALKTVEYTSLSELKGCSVSPAQAADICTIAFAKIFGADLVSSCFTIEEKRRIVDLMRDKYFNNEWNYYGKR